MKERFSGGGRRSRSVGASHKCNTFCSVCASSTYGSPGGVVMLYLSALMVLLGAVINAQSERQTREDSTEGPPRALGQRDARAADTVGASTG